MPNPPVIRNNPLMGATQLLRGAYPMTGATFHLHLQGNFGILPG